MKKSLERLPDIAELKAVAAILRNASITHAAAELGVKQSTLSYTLDRIRSRLGDPLFVRVGNRMVPTPCAEKLAEFAQRLVADMEREIDELSGFDPRTTQRTFRVAINEVGSIVMLPVLLRKLNIEAPSARLVPMQVKGAELESRLSSGELDVAAGHFPTAGANLFRQLLFRRKYLCIARRGHALARGSVSFEQLARTPQVVNDLMPAPYVWLHEQLTERGLGLPIAMVSQHGASIPFIVGATDFLAVVAEDVFALFKDSAGIEAVSLPVQLPQVDIFLYWHARVGTDPANMFLREVIKKAGRLPFAMQEAG
ncbi:LysR family transcriptional regulator [Pigmentiphaga kullae]|uniref:DNA-binding transcriptional LysR family regulator n=1 Tax=Pigmentiphaga kullae TaxID=151784 RepID=A0A4Q7NI33_9BURK|nr:LysR family transcriptional regulator [Pigmentiphaga kullae]RZS84655.1 DNA-binding transcriptional LysR family regulator [Pigmentiphaga kullae]